MPVSCCPDAGLQRSPKAARPRLDSTGAADVEFLSWLVLCLSLPLSSSFGLRCSCFSLTTLYCDVECLSAAGVVYHPTVLWCSPGAFDLAFISFVFVYCAMILAHVEVLCFSVSLSWSFALDVWISCRSPNSSWFSGLDRSCYEYWVRILVMDLLTRLRTWLSLRLRVLLLSCATTIFRRCGSRLDCHDPVELFCFFLGFVSVLDFVLLRDATPVWSLQPLTTMKDWGLCPIVTLSLVVLITDWKSVHSSIFSSSSGVFFFIVCWQRLHATCGKERLRSSSSSNQPLTWKLETRRI